MPKIHRTFRPRFTPQKSAADRGYRPDFASYDAQKARWIAQNPSATHDQYQDAMRAIASACGI